MVTRRRDRKKEWARNFFLVILAVSVVVIFFNLDIMRDGESVFSRSADKKIKFTGDIGHNDVTPKEMKRLVNYIKRYGDSIEKVVIDSSVQDTYKKLNPSTQLIFEIHVTMANGSTVSTPTRRTTRKDFMSAIITKLKKDMKAYDSLLKQGKKIKSLVNTM